MGRQLEEMRSAEFELAAPPSLQIMLQADVGDGTTSNPAVKRMEFATYHRWAVCMEDGGVELRVWAGGSANGVPYRVRKGDMIPAPGGHIMVGHAGASPAVDVLFEGLSSTDAVVRASNRSQVTTIAVGPGGLSRVEKSSDQFRVTLGAAAEFNYSASTVRALIRASSNNLNDAYVAQASGKVGAAATRKELVPGEWVELPVDTIAPNGTGTATKFGHLGTAGDFLYVTEFYR